MRIATVKEIKTKEARVGITPDGIATLVQDGHTVFVEHDASSQVGFTDAQYEQAGAKLIDQQSAWANAELERAHRIGIWYLRNDLTVFTYLHLAADPPAYEARPMS